MIDLPKKIGRYSVLGLTGQGGMGEIYIAVDPGLDRKVAIKVMKASLQNDPTMVARFLAEARTVAALNHPNVVTIHEVGITGIADEGVAPSLPYFVMEYIEGESLLAVMGRERLTPRQAAGFAVQVAEGLKAAHQKSLIHRDVKPSNLMVTSDGRVKILDFGLSKLIRDSASKDLLKLTADGMVTGTVEYLSPEQALGKPLDHRTDLFSFGIVLFEMLAGEHPFDGESATEKMAHILTQPQRRWPAEAKVPEPLQRVVDRALQKKLELRYQSAEEIIADLDAYLREAASGLAAPPRDGATAAVPAFREEPPATPRRVAGPWLAAALVVIALGGAVALWKRGEGARDAAPAGSTFTPVQITTSSGIDVFPTFSPDGNVLAYASDRSGRLEIYVRQLTAGGSEIQITKDGADNLQPAWSPDGQKIAYISKAKGGIWVVPALGGLPRRVTDFGSRPAWSPDGSVIAFQSDPFFDLNAGAFSALPPSAIYVVASSGGEPAPVTKPGAPTGGHGSPTFSPDGKRIAFVTYLRPNSELWSVGRDGKDLKLLSKTQPYYFDPVYSPDGKWIYLSTAKENTPSGAGLGLWKIDPKGGKPIEVLKIGQSTARHLAITRDGKKLAYSALFTTSNLWSVSSDGGGTPAQITHGNSRSTRPAFSPDGTKIAYSSFRTGVPNDLYLIDADGRNPVQLTTHPLADDFPSFFPDGTRLAFYSTRLGHPALFELSLRGRGEKLLADLGEGMELGRMSPDGKWIAYHSRKGGPVNVWVADVDGKNPRQLTFDTELMGFPCWSADSRFIAFEVKRGDDYHVAYVPREGGTPQLLTFAKGIDWPYSVAPDNDTIGFASERQGFWNIWTVSKATKREKRLTSYQKLNAYTRYPAFSPDGARVVYELAETTGNIWMVTP